MFWVRLRSGIILMVIAVFLLVMGGPVMNIGLLAVSLVGMYELYKVIDAADQGLLEEKRAEMDGLLAERREVLP